MKEVITEDGNNVILCDVCTEDEKKHQELRVFTCYDPDCKCDVCGNYDEDEF